MGLSTTYQPSEIEARWYPRWEQSGAFRCGARKKAKPYTIVIPPPNVTGSLHMGHALDNTLQDILIRFERMRGRDALWQPGIDHAGIATQMVVERNLAAEGINRRHMGREKFLARVWQWKDESGGIISRQLRRLGASCDWSRERFTMDAGFSKAVIRKFVTLYRQGLIYKDKRLVNWDPKLLTAISDLEVENREVDGHFWHFRYPIAGEPTRFIVVATTRPETMLGDVAVAVHPEDPRYKSLLGKLVDHPLTGRKIPIIADALANPKEGSGAVKITPAHDFNDFEAGKRHRLPMINVLEANGTVNANAPAPYRGIDRFEARKKVVADMEARGLLEKVEPRKFIAPFGDRSGVLLEPWLTDQWYVDAKKLAKAAIKAVEKGETRFVPKTWEKTYFEWMRNIQPWCISRQLWWGHRIPAWFAEDGSIFVAESVAGAKALAREKFKKNIELKQDEDVLDTWFSSALWPLGTLGWPGKTHDLKRHYPTSVLVTGFDIIFFWVARMMMDGLHFTKKVPFRTVYIHGLIRDEKGQKMSKAKGNVIDPLKFIDQYGADALRFTLATLETQGRDIKLAESRVAGYRNFATKLWNAARFCEMSGAVDAAGFDPKKAKHKVNQWIAGETRRAAEAVTRALEAFRFNEAADAIYHFTWHTFCDWYLERTKPMMGSFDKKLGIETRKTAAWVLDQILALLHPFMPFITEELWNAFGVKRKTNLILSAWPIIAFIPKFSSSVNEISNANDFISSIRSIRTELNLPVRAKINLHFLVLNNETKLLLNNSGNEISRLANVEQFGLISKGEIPKESIQFVHSGNTFVIPLRGLINYSEAKEKLEKDIVEISKIISVLEGKLKNKGFTANAPEAVVLETKQRFDTALATRKKLEDGLGRLG